MSYCIVFLCLTLLILLFGDNSHGHGWLMCRLCSAQWEAANLQRAEGALERVFGRGVSLLHFFLPLWWSNPVINLKTHQLPLTSSRRTAATKTRWESRRPQRSQTSSTVCLCVCTWTCAQKEKREALEILLSVMVRSVQEEWTREEKIPQEQRHLNHLQTQSHAQKN